MKGNVYQPLSQNLYGYVLGNPVRYVDPSGHMAVGEGADPVSYAKCGSKGVWDTVGAIAERKLFDLGLDMLSVVGNVKAFESGIGDGLMEGILPPEIIDVVTAGKPSFRGTEAYYWGKVVGDLIGLGVSSAALKLSAAATILTIGAQGTLIAVTLGGGTVTVPAAVVLVVVEVGVAALSAGAMYSFFNKLGDDFEDLCISKAEDVASEGPGSKIQFGSDTKSTQKLTNQMNQRGWTESSVRGTVDSPYTTRVSINKATGNPATVYYNPNGAYVIIDDVTKAVVQVSDNINPSTWIPDPSIINPYKP